MRARGLFPWGHSKPAAAPTHGPAGGWNASTLWRSGHMPGLQEASIFTSRWSTKEQP